MCECVCVYVCAFHTHSKFAQVNAPDLTDLDFQVAIVAIFRYEQEVLPAKAETLLQEGEIVE